MSTNQVAVVIGASRGVGLALAEALEGRGYTVLAAVRSSKGSIGSCEVIQVPTGVQLLGVDVNDEGSLEHIKSALEGRKIAVLVIAAGSQEMDKLENVTKDVIRRQMETNAIGPLFTVKHLQDSLEKGSKVLLISSRNGSIEDVEATGGELYGYRMSKVAINMAGKVLAGDLKQQPGALVGLIHPGVVNTDMLRTLRKGRGVAEDKLTLNTLTPEQSASKILGVSDGLNEENSGSFWNADTGKIIPW